MFGLFKPKPAPAAAAPDPVSEGAEHILRRLEWTVIRRLDGLLQGDYRTLLRGAGIDLLTCASTSTTTTCATLTGTSPPGCKSPMCACSPKTAR